MKDSTPIPPPISGSAEPRRCPVCGSRVADRANECLMCGTSLVEEEETPAAETPARRFQIPWRGILASIVTVSAFIALVVWLVQAQILGYSITPTPAFTPTATRRPTHTPLPTETLTPTLSPTPIPPRVHQVQRGETCVGIAVQYSISLEMLGALNPTKCPDGILIPGDLLLIPAAPLAPEPTITFGPGTPSPTPQCPILHVVQPDETALGIAERYNIAFDVIEAANPDKDLDQLKVNQVLRVPCGTPVPTPTPTMDPNATPTPIPKYAAPVLLSPPDGATLATNLVPLQWTAVSLLGEDEWYAVRLRRLDQDAPVESVLVKTTLVRLDAAFAPSSDESAREYSWEVTVVREAGTSVTGETRYSAASHPSARRTFRWLIPTPQPTLTATPLP